jgi:chemotaxis protein CheX
MTHTDPVISHQDIVAAIRASTADVFATMLGLEITAEDMQTEPAVTAAPSSGVVSLIGLAGNWCGTGSLACTLAFACRMATHLVATPYDSVNEDVLDAAGEITNMIIGNVKTVLEEKVGPMGLSSPTVIYGRNFQTRSARIHEWIIVPFACGEERLFVQMCLAPNPDSRSRNGNKGTLRAGFQVPQVLTG